MATPRRGYGLEWPTLGLTFVTYGVWFLALRYATDISLWISIPLLALTCTMHSSLQHETIHGHPLPNRFVSALLVFPAIGLFIPYLRFRDLHLAHHKNSRLTDPYDDPESSYWDPKVFIRLSRPMQAALRLNNTLLGRMLIGPLLGQEAFMRTELKAIRRGDRKAMVAWLLHFAGVAPVIWVLMQVGTMPFWAYLTAAYLGLSVLKVRTFLEHQAHEMAAGRTVIIDDHGPLAVLFLNNNLHAVHHAFPRTPWYQLPRLFRERRAHWLRRNLGYYFPSYGAVFRRFLLTAKEPLVHPFWKNE